MTARKLPGFHTQAGEAYHGEMLGVCVSAGTLAILDWHRIWWFLPIAVGSVDEARRRRVGWRLPALASEDA